MEHVRARYVRKVKNGSWLTWSISGIFSVYAKTLDLGNYYIHYGVFVTREVNRNIEEGFK